MADGSLILRSTRAWPWGLVLVADAETSEQVPTRFGEAIAVGSRSTIVSRILHEVDGEATAEVWMDRHPTGMACVYDEPFVVSSGRLCLSDAGMQERSEAPIEPASWRARAYVDDEQHPRLVIVSLDRR